jgi:hypothetical protein
MIKNTRKMLHQRVDPEHTVRIVDAKLANKLPETGRVAVRISNVSEQSPHSQSVKTPSQPTQLSIFIGEPKRDFSKLSAGGQRKDFTLQL